jgi:hypothetical protein
MRAYLFIIALAAASSAALAEPASDSRQTTAKMADHPAVAVQRLWHAQGYDYASKFYPHPAWLYLYPEAPDVIAAKRQQRQEALARADAPQAANGSTR